MKCPICQRTEMNDGERKIGRCFWCVCRETNEIQRQRVCANDAMFACTVMLTLFGLATVGGIVWFLISGA